MTSPDNILLQMSASLARIEERVASMISTVIDVHNTIRGSSGDPGLVSKVDAIMQDIQKFEAMRLEIDDLKTKVSALRADHEALKKTLLNHPTLLWLLHNKTKETASSLLAIFALLLLIFRSLIFGDLKTFSTKVTELFVSVFGF